MIDTESLLSFFNRPSSDKELNDYMKKNNILLAKELSLGSDEYRAYIERPTEGFCLVFTDEAAFLGKDNQPIGKGDLFYTGVFFHAEGKDGYSQYRYKLPNDIDFSETHEDLIKKLGEPTWQRKSRDGQRIIADRWDLNEHRVHVSYSKKNETVEIVSASIPDSD